ncbi:MAG: hypothetical protein PHF17_10335 [Arcobacteraceae bacterium]|nr:hypothetical protein [Arcobacteraceae bacterium]
MSNETKIIQLANSKKGFISITTINEPYGKGTDTVTSIAISLNGADIEWKVHIPMANLDEVIASLQDIKK